MEVMRKVSFFFLVFPEELDLLHKKKRSWKSFLSNSRMGLPSAEKEKPGDEASFAW